MQRQAQTIRKQLYNQDRGRTSSKAKAAEVSISPLNRSQQWISMHLQHTPSQMRYNEQNRITLLAAWKSTWNRESQQAQLEISMQRHFISMQAKIPRSKWHRLASLFQFSEPIRIRKKQRGTIKTTFSADASSSFKIPCEDKRRAQHNHPQTS